MTLARAIQCSCVSEAVSLAVSNNHKMENWKQMNGTTALRSLILRDNRDMDARLKSSSVSF